MQNERETNLDKQEINIDEMHKEIEEKAMENLNPSEVKKMFSELNGESDSKVDNVLGNLFYESVKLIFDVGFDLAKKLNLDLFESFKFDEKKDES